MKDERFDSRENTQHQFDTSNTGDDHLLGGKKPEAPGDQKAKPKPAPPSKPEHRTVPVKIKRFSHFSSFDQAMARLDAIRSRLTTYDGPDKVISATGNLLNQAEQAIKDGRIFSARRLSKEAERLELSLVSDEQLLARAYSLQYDTPIRFNSTLSGQVIDILGDADEVRKQAVDASDTTWKHRIIEAVRIRDKLVEDLHAAKDRVQRSLSLLCWALVGFVASLFYILWTTPSLIMEFYGILGPTNDYANPYLRLFGAALCLGGIGACLSAMMNFTYFKRAPGEFETIWVTLARPLIGATSGFIAILLTPILPMNFENQVVGVCALAFLFGFSERLVIGTVQRFEDRQKSDGDDG